MIIEKLKLLFHKPECPHCHRKARDIVDVKVLKELGMCLQCDKHSFEAREQARWERGDNE